MVIEKAKRLVEYRQRRRHPARLDHPPRARLQHDRARRRARSSPAASTRTRSRSRSASSAPRATSRRAARSRSSPRPSSTPARGWTTSSSRSSRGPATWRSTWTAGSRRPARLPRHRHQQVGDPQGRAPHREARAQPDLDPAQGPHAALDGGGDGAPPREAREVQDEPGVPQLDVGGVGVESGGTLALRASGRFPPSPPPRLLFSRRARGASSPAADSPSRALLLAASFPSGPAATRGAVRSAPLQAEDREKKTRRRRAPRGRAGARRESSAASKRSSRGS